jgi:hypothetical protein
MCGVRWLVCHGCVLWLKPSAEAEEGAKKVAEGQLAWAFRMNCAMGWRTKNEKKNESEKGEN